jgi:hypothetical protein
MSGAGGSDGAGPAGPTPEQWQWMVAQVQGSAQRVAAAEAALAALQQQHGAAGAVGSGAAPAAPYAAPAPRPGKPEKFSGGKADAMRVDVWLFAMEKYFAAVGPALSADADRLRHTLPLLQGHALEWWQFEETSAAAGGPALPATWAAFRMALQQRFQPISAALKARDRLYTLRQSGSVAAYAAEMQRQLILCPDVSVQERLHRFIAGLKPAVQRELRLREPADLAAAIAMAERVDEIDRVPSRWSYGRAAGGASSSPAPMELGVAWEQKEPDAEEEELSPEDAEAEALVLLAAARARRPGNAGASEARQPFAPSQPRAPPAAAAPPRPAAWARRGPGAICRLCDQPGHGMSTCPRTAEARRALGL